MPNIISNDKSLKKSEKRRLFKLSYRKKTKNIVKDGLLKGNINDIYKILDSQLSKGLIKKNKCNRLKSRYMTQINNQAGK